MGLFRKKLWLGMRVDRLELGACDLEFVCILYLGIFRGLRPGQGQRKKEDNRTVLTASPGGHIMHFLSIQSPSLQSAHVHCTPIFTILLWMLLLPVHSHLVGYLGIHFRAGLIQSVPPLLVSGGCPQP